MKKRTDFPFSPNNSPFFYGWAIVAIGTLGMLCSVPGQTMGVSVFTDHLIDSFNITRDQLSFSYMIGTFTSSLFLTKAGRLLDRFGARVMIVIAISILALSLCLISTAPRIISYISIDPSKLLIISILAFSFSLLRFSGQGMVSMISRTMMMKWFDKKRGLANAISSAFVSVGFSLAPLIFASTIKEFNWDGAYQVIALGLIFFALIAAIFYRDNPEECGLLPDGVISKESSIGVTPKSKYRQFSLKEAKGTIALWGIVLSTAFYSFFMSGFTFHVISIFKSVGMDSEKALSVFIPSTAIAVVLSFIAGTVSDYIKINWLIYLYLLGGLLASIGLIFLGDNIFFTLLTIGIGIISGTYTVLMSVALPRYFGRKHLGAISGFNMSRIVFSSSIAPIMFSLIFSSFGNYAIAGVVALIYILILFAISIRIKNPQINS